jgi:hypothetical protein
VRVKSEISLRGGDIVECCWYIGVRQCVLRFGDLRYSFCSFTDKYLSSPSCLTLLTEKLDLFARFVLTSNTIWLIFGEISTRLPRDGLLLGGRAFGAIWKLWKRLKNDGGRWEKLENEIIINHHFPYLAIFYHGPGLRAVASVRFQSTSHAFNLLT